MAYCAEIGLEPTIITNAQALCSRRAVARYRAGRDPRDFLVSVQGLGAVYDLLVRRPGAHEHQMKALRNLQEEGIPFRFNTVLSKPALPQIADIARLAVRTGAEVVNFLGFNPFNDQETGKRSAENVPRYGELGPALDEALDILAEAGVEANVRYLPFCVVAERHRASVYDFPQIPYDLHENDFASWSWTDLPAQRTRGAALTPPLALGPRLRLGPLRRPLRRLAARLPRVGAGLHQIKQRIELALSRPRGDAPARGALPGGRAHAGPRIHRLPARRRPARRAMPEQICDGLYADYVDALRPGRRAPHRPRRSRDRSAALRPAGRRRGSTRTTSPGSPADRTLRAGRAASRSTARAAPAALLRAG